MDSSYAELLETKPPFGATARRTPTGPGVVVAVVVGRLTSATQTTEPDALTMERGFDEDSLNAAPLFCGVLLAQYGTLPLPLGAG